MENNVTKGQVYAAGKYGWKPLFKMALLLAACMLPFIAVQNQLGGLWKSSKIITGAGELALAPYLMVGYGNPAAKAIKRSFSEMKGNVWQYYWQVIRILGLRLLLVGCLLFIAVGVAEGTLDILEIKGNVWRLGYLFLFLYVLYLAPYMQLIYAGFFSRWLPRDWAKKQTPKES